MSKKQVVVVSLFDGLSGGRLAFDRIGHIEVLRYYSSEIDKYAIQVADNNWPQDTPHRLGSVIDVDGVTLLKEIREEFGDVDIVLIGGSPCQGFSLAGKLKGSSTVCGKDVTTLEQYLVLKEMDFEFNGQSYLFWEYVRIWKELNPKYFMLENVRVTKTWLPMFNDTMGVEPLRINSSLVSAQNRDRYYWTNIQGVEQPNDERKNLVIRDILDDNVVCQQKIENDICLVDKSVKPSIAKNIIEQHEDIIKSDRDFYQMKCTSGFQDNKIGLKKSPCLRAGNSATYILQRPCGVVITDSKLEEKIYKNGVCSIEYYNENKHSYRKLTPLECERLQTIPDNYTLVSDDNGKQLVSNSQRYKMIGNGWTIDVPAHIFRHIPIQAAVEEIDDKYFDVGVSMVVAKHNSLESQKRKIDKRRLDEV